MRQTVAKAIKKAVYGDNAYKNNNQHLRRKYRTMKKMYRKMSLIDKQKLFK
jgi:hypothetical protein